MQERIIRELDLPKFGYRVYAKDPAFFTPFPDGRHLTMWQDQKRTREEIAKFSRKDAEVYPVYEEFIERVLREIRRKHVAAHSAEFHKNNLERSRRSRQTRPGINAHAGR